MEGIEIFTTRIELKLTVKESYWLKSYIQNPKPSDSEEDLKMKKELFNTIPTSLSMNRAPITPCPPAAAVRPLGGF